MPANSVIRPKGLYTNPNPFSVSPEGALLAADNMVIDEDGIARGRRGQALLTTGDANADGLHSSTGYRPVKCWWYNNRIWVQYRRPTVDSDGVKERIFFWDWVGTWGQALSTATTFDIDSTGKIKVRQTEANRRQLICTATGVKRGMSGTTVGAGTAVIDAGVCKGIDIRHTALTTGLYSVSDPMPTLTTCAYRVVWSVTDDNKIVTIGSPSGKIVIRNTTAGLRSPTIVVGIPSGAGTASLCQIYRTQFFKALPDGSYPDPGDEMFLCSQVTPTTTDLTNKYFTFNDIAPDALLGEPLYTNSTQEGALQEKSIPPASKDVAYFNDTGFYLNTISKQRMIFSILAVNPTLVAANSGITVGDVIQVGDLAMLAVDGGTNADGIPVAAESIAGPTYWAFAVNRSTGVGSEVNRVLKTTESFCYKYNLWSNIAGGRYYAYNLTGADDLVGKVLIEERSINGSVKAYFGASRIDNPPNYIPTPVANTAATVGLSKQITNVDNNGTVVTITSAAHGYSTNDKIFFSWFGLVQSATNSKVSPNEYTITVTGANTFTFPSPSGAAIGVDAGAPVAYSHLTILTAKSDNDARVNRLAYSALQEPECVPILNYFDIGRNDQDGLAMKVLGTSLFVFKEDGLFRVTGTNGSFQVDEFDPTVRLLAPESVAVVNNCIYCLTDQGVTRITEGGAQVVSREIENELFDLMTTRTSDNRKEAFGIGYEDDRKYILWMVADSSGKPSRGYVYNIFTKAWTRRTDQANCGLVGRRNDVLTDIQKLYTLKDKESWLTMERKTGTMLDYADESISVFSGYAGALASSIRFNGTAITERDYFFDGLNPLIVFNNAGVYNRAVVTDVVLLGAGVDLVTVETDLNNTSEGVSQSRPNAWGTITNLSIYKAIPHVLTFSHFVGDDLFMAKVMSEIHIAFERPYFTELFIYFRTDLHPDFSTKVVTINGYGYPNWMNKFPWALRDYEDADLLGRSLRSLVPTVYSKCSQMLLTMKHYRPWENFRVNGVKFRVQGGTPNIQRDNK